MYQIVFLLPDMSASTGTPAGGGGGDLLTPMSALSLDEASTPTKPTTQPTAHMVSSHNNH